MAGACLLPDGQPFSFGHRDTPSQSGQRDEMALGSVHEAIQYPPQDLWPLVRGSLQGIDGGWKREWLLADRVRLRSPQSHASQANQRGRAAGNFHLEQLWALFERTPPTPGLAEGGSVVGREGNSPRQRGRKARIRVANGAATSRGRDHGSRATSPRLV